MLMVRASHARQFMLHTQWLVGGRASHARQIMLHTQCWVSRTPYDFTNTEATVSWTSSRGIELMASSEDKLSRRREREDRRKLQEKEKYQPN